MAFCFIQNNLDYSSLAILTRCLQAPVPNLGQFAPPVPASPTTFSPDVVAIPTFAAVSNPAIPAADVPVNGGPVVGLRESFNHVGIVPSQIVENVSSGFHRAYPAASVPLQVLPESHPAPGQYGAQFPTHPQPPIDAEDDFADFQAAVAPSRSSVTQIHGELFKH